MKLITDKRNYSFFGIFALSILDERKKPKEIYNILKRGCPNKKTMMRSSQPVVRKKTVFEHPEQGTPDIFWSIYP